MLPLVMLPEQRLRNSVIVGLIILARNAETCYVLKYYRIVRGRSWCLTPGEWRMAGHENAGHGDGVEFAKTFNNHLAGIELIGCLDLFIGELRRNGHFAVEVVSMGGSEAWNRRSYLRPRCGKLRVGMDDASDGREFLVNEQMGWKVGRRISAPSTMAPSKSVMTKSSAFSLS